MSNKIQKSEFPQFNEVKKRLAILCDGGDDNLVGFGKTDKREEKKGGSHEGYSCNERNWQA